MTIGGFSLWTVIPLGWIWAVSQLSDTQQPKLSSYLLILVGIVGSVLLVAKLLAMLNRRFLVLTGTDGSDRVPLPWMQSMRDERRGLRATALDVVLIVSAALAIAALVIWFFVAAGSPLPS